MTETPRGRPIQVQRPGVRRQLVASIGLASVIVGIALVVIVQIVLAGAADRATARVLNERADALQAAISTVQAGAAIAVPQELQGPGVGIYDATGMLIAGSVPPSLQTQFDALSTATAQTIDRSDDQYAVMASPFTTSNGLRGVLVLTEPLAPYESSEQSALIVSIIAAVLIVVLSTTLTAWTTKRALAPVSEMAHAADRWSEHDLDKRFDLGAPTDEIRALGSTLDRLLAKVASAIRAEQRLTSELAHELRTPLTTISGTVDLLLMRDDLDPEHAADLEMIRRSSIAMSQTITVLLDVARETHNRSTAQTTMPDVERSLRSVNSSGDQVHLSLAQGAVVDVPPPLVYRVLAPLIENASAYADNVWVSTAVDSGQVVFCIADDGPGIPPELTSSVFEPGVSGRGGSGLGLALARRVARSVGGDVTIDPRSSEHGGATLLAVFPSA